MEGSDGSDNVRLDIELCFHARESWARMLRVNPSCLTDPGIRLICGSNCGTGSHVSVVDLSCHGHHRATCAGTG